MEYTQDQIVTLANNIKEYEEKRKDLAKEIKEAKEDFCKDHDIKKKPLNAALKQFFVWQKDRAKFLEEVNETDQLVDVMTGEKVCTFE